MKFATTQELIDNRRRHIFNEDGRKETGFYGIKYGKDKYLKKIVTGFVAFSWEECKYYTSGVKSAKFKKFDNFTDALDFARNGY